MGDSQEDDRRMIAELVAGRMQNVCRPPIPKTTSRGSGKYILKTFIFQHFIFIFFLVSGSPTEETAPLVPGTRPVPLGGSQVRIFNILFFIFYFWN